MNPVLALILALSGPPGPHNLWIGVVPTEAKAQLMVQRFRQMVRETKAPCGNLKIWVEWEFHDGQDFFWPKVDVSPRQGYECALATWKIWVNFNDLENDGGRTVYAFTYQGPK